VERSHFWLYVFSFLSFFFFVSVQSFPTLQVGLDT
jgi:hypothetical protein